MASNIIRKVSSAGSHRKPETVDDKTLRTWMDEEFADYGGGARLARKMGISPAGAGALRRHKASAALDKLAAYYGYQWSEDAAMWVRSNAKLDPRMAGRKQWTSEFVATVKARLAGPKPATVVTVAKEQGVSETALRCALRKANIRLKASTTMTTKTEVFYGQLPAVTAYVLGCNGGLSEDLCREWWIQRAMEPIEWTLGAPRHRLPAHNSTDAQYDRGPSEPYRQMSDARIHDVERKLNEAIQRGVDVQNASCQLTDAENHQLDVEMGEVRDWLNALPEIRPELLKNRRLMAMTWKHAADAADAWHAALAKQKRLAVAGEEGLALVAKSGDHTWVRIMTAEALDRESAVMGHCVGRGGYDHYVGSNYVAAGIAWGIYSLRDSAGQSHATLEVNRRRIIQIQGPGNTPPTEDHIKHFAALDRAFPVMQIDWKPWVRDERTGNIHRMSQLPADAVIDGDVDYEPHDLQFLPPRLTVKGNLKLSFSSAWTDGTIEFHPSGDGWIPPEVFTLPDDLTVTGDLAIYGLKYVPQGKGLTVGGKVNCYTDDEDTTA